LAGAYGVLPAPAAQVHAFHLLCTGRCMR
jgi:hypothetical protein